MELERKIGPCVTLRFTCEPRKGHYKKNAPSLPDGVCWSVGMHYSAEEFGLWMEVKDVSVDSDGNVHVWLEDAEEDSGTPVENVSEYYKKYGWSV